MNDMALEFLFKVNMAVVEYFVKEVVQVKSTRTRYVRVHAGDVFPLYE